jgi:hypothetical protein
MDPSESSGQSFIIHIWLEETIEETGRAIWRGRITHVPSGTRRSLKDLIGIVMFMLPYLEGMGVRCGLGWRIWRRLKHTAP